MVTQLGYHLGGTSKATIFRDEADGVVNVSIIQQGERGGVLYTLLSGDEGA
jgi:hypothetical protein